MGHGLSAPLAQLRQCHCTETAIVRTISPQLRHLPQTEICLFYLHAQSDLDPSVPWEVDPATKRLHAATEDAACCQEDWRSHMPQLGPSRAK